MKLGELIKQVREIVPYSPNIPLKGLTSEKCFVDIDLQKIDKEKPLLLVKKNQFCYSPFHLPNLGQGIPVALNESEEIIAVFSAYITFEVINTEFLLPKYLMLWLSRDRLNYLTHYFAQGSCLRQFPFKKLCDFEIRIPQPSEQKELIRRYVAVQKSIQIKRRINETLERWMECYYQILFGSLSKDKLKKRKLGDLLIITIGGCPPRTHPEYFCKSGKGISWIKIGDITNSKVKFIERGEEDLTLEGLKNCNAKLAPEGSILFPKYGDKNYTLALASSSLICNSYIWALNCSSGTQLRNTFLYFFLKFETKKDYFLRTIVLGWYLKSKDFQELIVSEPPLLLISTFNYICKPFLELQKANDKEITELIKLQKYLIELTN